MRERKIKRGDIYHANLNPVMGSEQGGFRPVLIIQNNRGNQYSSTVIVASITSRPKHKMPTHVALREIQGLEKDSVVLLEQIRTIDKGRLDGYIGTLDEQQMLRIDKALRVSIGIKKLYKPILMCICSECIKPFYASKKYSIKRVGARQEEKGVCIICADQIGYEHLIGNK